MTTVERSDLLVCDHCRGQAEQEFAMGWFRLTRPGDLSVLEDSFADGGLDACSIPCATALITSVTAGSRDQPINPEAPS